MIYETIAKMMKVVEIEEDCLTTEESIALAIIRNAQEGKVEAIKFIRAACADVAQTQQIEQDGPMEIVIKVV